jgi:hypothetical protein
MDVPALVPMTFRLNGRPFQGAIAMVCDKRRQYKERVSDAGTIKTKSGW